MKGYPLGPAASTTLVPGEYAVVYVTEAKGHTLRGNLLWKTSLSDFTRFESSHLNVMDPSNLDHFTEYLLRYHNLRLDAEETPLAVSGH
jgi:hypothetical protein